jgi:hypothetical protein
MLMDSVIIPFSSACADERVYSETSPISVYQHNEAHEA